MPTTENDKNYHETESKNIKEKINLIFGKCRIDYNLDEFVVVCPVKNGESYINNFIHHYKKLGARHIFFIDNNSTDDTILKIKKHHDVSIYETGLKFSDYECEIRNTIIKKVSSNRWCMAVDIDEFFDYPYAGKISMQQFIQYLNANKYTGVVAYMLDMFPKNPLSFSDKKKDEDFTKTCCYYDISAIIKNNYPLHYKECNNNRLSNDLVREYMGGIRRNIFGNNSIFLLIKHPLLFIDEKIIPFATPHFCNNAYLADVTCVLKHYKFINSFFEKVENVIRENNYPEYAMIEYKMYHEYFLKNNSISFYSNNSKEYTTAKNLIRNKFIGISDNYKKYANHGKLLPAKKIKYCLLTNHAETTLESNSYSNIYQWLNVFDGQLYKPDDFLDNYDCNTFDIIHVDVTNSDNIYFISKVRKKIKNLKKTKLIANFDLPLHYLQSEKLNFKLLKNELSKADFIFASDYNKASLLEELLSNKKVRIIPNPINYNKLKLINLEVKYNEILFICDRYNKDIHILYYSLQEQGFKPKLLYLKNTNFDIPNDLKINYMTVNNLKDIYEKILEYKIIFIPFVFNRCSEIIADLAYLGIIVIGNYLIESLRRCYSYTATDPSNINEILYKINKIYSDKKYENFIANTARYESEYYNFENSKKRLFDILYNETECLSKIKPNGNTSEVAYHNEIKHIFGEKKINYNVNEFVVITAVKDGSFYIKNFIEHYLRLGAKHIFFIDNNSSDDTVSIIKQHSNVSIYSTSLSFQKYDNEIKNTIIKYLCKDRWCMYIDIDEFFDYPHSDKISMNEFIDYLNKNKYTAVIAYMLDMFAENFNAYKIDDYCYYDISNIQKLDYFTSYLLPYCSFNILSNNDIKFYYGGIRLMHTNNKSVMYYLIKHPLMFIDNLIEPFTLSHYCNGAHIADVSCLLKHYKMIFSLPEKVKNIFNAEYTHYYYRMEYDEYRNFLKNNVSFFSDKSTKFDNVNTLIGDFLTVSDKYSSFVNKKGKR